MGADKIQDRQDVTPTSDVELEARGAGTPLASPILSAADALAFASEADWYYSALGRAVQAHSAKALPAQGWLGTIQGWINKGTVKPDEVEWSGVREWLALQEGKVTKDAVAAFLADNGVRVQEVTLGAPSGQDTYRERLRAMDDDELQAEAYENNVDPEEYRDDEREEMIHAIIASYSEDMGNAMTREVGDSKYSQYSLPGGSNYREVLLTLPRKGDEPDEGSDLPSMRRGRRQADRAAGNYRSSHWEDPNIVAHIRVNDRVDADGKRVLFVEEVQSDWAQDGRKKGFGGKPEYKAIKRGPGEFATELYVDGQLRGEYPTRHLAEQAFKESQIPRAPFVESTPAWVTLALKRIVKMGVDGGYDKVAFVTGEQSAERYSLSKQVRSIEWTGSRDGTKTVNIEPLGGNTIEFKVLPDGTTASMSGGVSGNEFTGKKLDEVVGKEVADAIMAERDGTLSGDGLKVGGSGMVSFYDKIVPTTANKLLERLGGGKMGVVEIGTPIRNDYTVTRATVAGREEWRVWDDADKLVAKHATEAEAEADAAKRNGRRRKNLLAQPGFTITDAMRDKAGEGLPLFSQRSDAQAKAKALGLPATGKTEDIEDMVRIATSDPRTWSRAEFDKIAPHLSMHQMLRNPSEADVQDVLDNGLRTGQVDSVDSFLRGHYTFAGGALRGVPTAVFVTMGLKFNRPGSNTVAPGSKPLFVITPAKGQDLYDAIRQTARMPERNDGPAFSQSHGFHTREIQVQGKWRPIEDSTGRLLAQGDFAKQQAFWRWFGSSATVDKSGRPVALYHGTTEDFSSFDKEKVGSRFPFSIAYHFTTRPSEASLYASGLDDKKPPADGANVMPVYVRITNPLIIDTKHPAASMEADLGRGPILDKMREARLRGEPYDGIIIRRERGDEWDGWNVIAFRPEQIKGVFNRGTFDAGSPDILFSQAEPTRRAFLVGTAAALASSPASADTTLGKARPVSAKVLDQRLPAAVEKLLVGSRHGTTNIEGAKAIRQALNIIAATGPQEVRALAGEIRKLMPESGVGVQVDKGNWSAHGAVEMSPMVRLRLFDGEKSHGMDYGTFLHESLHVAVVARYRALSSGLVRSNDAVLGMSAPAAKDAMAQFRGVWDEFKAVALRGLNDAPRGSELRLSMEEAIGNPDEFFVRAFTDATLQAWMAQQEYKGKTLFERFKDWVKSSLLGMKTEGTRASWLDAALAASDDLLQAMAGDKPDFARLHAISNARAGNAHRSKVAGDDVMFSQASDAASAALRSITVDNVRKHAGYKFADYRSLGLGALGRRQLTELYAKDIPQLDGYNRTVQQMDAEKNGEAAAADELANQWGRLKDERQLAELMHDATLAKIDPAREHQAGDNRADYAALRTRWERLSPEAQATYTQARDMYEEHYARVREAVRERIERSEIREERKAELLARMDGEFFDRIQGVYFPLARFGQYVITAKDGEGRTLAVSRAETMAEAERARGELRAAYPEATISKVLKAAEFNAARDGVGRGFLKSLFDTLDAQGASTPELEDAINQLYLSSLPDLSWAKHGIHRKGTPGYSQDARRAFAQNMFHGARYLAKLRHADQLQRLLDAMQKHVKDSEAVDGFDSVKAQQVVDEMVKRHDILMNPKTHPLSTALTSLGFVFHLGLSPASAAVNLSQTALVAYPLMGAKWGFAKAGKALLDASKLTVQAKNDLREVLKGDELKAMNEAVDAGVIDVTMAHDLAGIAQGEDSKVYWKVRPVMRAASFLFHHAERFNRQATFIAAYRLERAKGANHEAAAHAATEVTYASHFDLSSANRPRFMQGNVARVVLLFKQFAQNMVYTLVRQASLAIKAETPAERARARKAFAGLMVSHAMGAGILGLPLVGTLLAAASAIGSSDDEPWDAEVALRNMLAETIGHKPAEVLTRGLSRLTPWDISGRVGLDKLILPDVQEGLEGARLAESVMTAALGPVAGIGVNAAKGLQKIAEGDWARGLEDMLPTALRSPMKAIRYADEGALDARTGIAIREEVGAAGVLGQALGFSPSEVRNAQEGKTAIRAMDLRISERRRTLLQMYSKAMALGDTDGAADAKEAIRAFNQAQPEYAIKQGSMLKSLENRRRRIREAEDGVFLPRGKQSAREAGAFAREDE